MVEKGRKNEYVWKTRNTRGSLGLEQPALVGTDIVQREQELTHTRKVRSCGLCLHDFPQAISPSTAPSDNKLHQEIFAEGKPPSSLNSTLLQVFLCSGKTWQYSFVLPQSAVHSLREYPACPVSDCPVLAFLSAMSSHISSVWLSVLHRVIKILDISENACDF